MKKLIKKPLFIVAVIAVVFLIAWFFYSRRKRDYEDWGNSNWAGETDFPGKLSFRTEKPSGLKVGDKIKIVQDSQNPPYRSIDGEKVVLEIMLPSQTHHKDHWFVVDQAHPGSGTQTPGTYQKV